MSVSPGARHACASSLGPAALPRRSQLCAACTTDRLQSVDGPPAAGAPLQDIAYIGRRDIASRRGPPRHGRLSGDDQMTAAKWWLRVVGTLYLLEGGGLTLMALLAPEQFAATWAVAPVGSIDALGVRAALIGGLPGVLTWALLGAMAWIYSGAPRDVNRRHRWELPSGYWWSRVYAARVTRAVLTTIHAAPALHRYCGALRNLSWHQAPSTGGKTAQRYPVRAVACPEQWCHRRSWNLRHVKRTARCRPHDDLDPIGDVSHVERAQHVHTSSPRFVLRTFAIARARCRSSSWLLSSWAGGPRCCDVGRRPTSSGGGGLLPSRNRSQVGAVRATHSARR